jgi:hypothetical protein
MLMFTVSGMDQRCDSMPSSRLSQLGILETTHLEKWIVDYPEVLGDGAKIVTSQYDKWSSLYKGQSLAALAKQCDEG